MSQDMLPLPKPAGFRTRYRSEPGMIGHYPWAYTDKPSRRAFDGPEHESECLYTATQLQQYAAQQVAAERERAAGLVEALREAEARPLVTEGADWWIKVRAALTTYGSKAMTRKEKA